MYRQKFTIMPSEVGCTGEIKMRAFLNRLQDAAGLAVGAGSPGELMRRGYAWVLLKYELKVEKHLPGIGETVLLETRHTPGDGFYTLRVFRVFHEKNEAESWGSAKTSWVLIDLAAGRPVRATQRVPEIFSDVAGDPPIDGDFMAIPKLSGPHENEKALHEKSFEVRFHDLDANGHVNNAVYFEWIWEAPPDPLDWSVREIYAEFRISVKFGDTVRVRMKEQPSTEAGTRCWVYDMTVAEDPKARSVARFFAVWVSR